MLVLGTSPEVARVSFSIPSSPSSPGSYDATAPPQEYGYTPLTVGLAANATTGAGNRLNAASGKVVVVFADASSGLFYGTLDATFVDGTHLTGEWVCHAGQ
jgi:hypothetical protein